MSGQSTSPGTPLWVGASWAAQVVYVSHLFGYPLLFLVWWLRGRSRVRFTNGSKSRSA